MRLWTLHPRYLDAKGLVAAWREGLLAQRVLAGGTRGYRSHPQLERFRASAEPLAAVATWLAQVLAEAERRSYSFDASRIAEPGRAALGSIPAKAGQLEYEARLLGRKLAARDPLRQRELAAQVRLEPNPLFRIVPGGVEGWERAIPGL
ncbi:MAG TPA: pyrimidine dimer DNA glycosylase/endonuclease V [Rectinemataceae bacterium]|nr:pyrimidine dimer DNA glycosylase/endonuclease V [Rectinemataceae bacterium]